MSAALLYNFSDCSSPSPLNTPIARRGLSYHKVSGGSRSTIGIVERRPSNALSSLSTSSSSKRPSIHDLKQENSRPNGSVSCSQATNSLHHPTRRTASSKALKEPAAERATDATSPLTTQKWNAETDLPSQEEQDPLSANQKKAKHEHGSASAGGSLGTGHATATVGGSDQDSIHIMNNGQKTESTSSEFLDKIKAERSFKAIVRSLGFKSLKPGKSGGVKRTPKSSARSDPVDETSSDVHPQAASSVDVECQKCTSTGLISIAKPTTPSIRSDNFRREPSKNKRGSILRRSTDTAKLSFGGGGRRSLDSTRNVGPGFDEAVRHRAVLRTTKLQELVQSEEGYVADLKVLFNVCEMVYLALLESTAQTPTRFLTHFQQNVSEILDLHQELLALLKERVSSLNTMEYRSKRSSVLTRVRSRKNSDESSRAATFKRAATAKRLSFELDPILDTQEVEDVAGIFDRLMSRFFVYEEYGARYQSVARSLAAMSRTVPNWTAYERSIEALANTLVSTGEDGGRRGLSFEDLLIKPVQRICRYPLFLTDLHKYTPAVDGPEARVELEKILFRFRETIREIDKTTNNEQARHRIQRSWHLQDLVAFPDFPTTPPSLRPLGHPTLCGVLYVAYQTNRGPRGAYMLCALFQSYLLLATSHFTEDKFQVRALLGLADVRVESVDDGRGLQCSSAAYAWKVAFQSEEQLYELVLCACSRKEEEQWRTKIQDHSRLECQKQVAEHAVTPLLYSMLDLPARSLGHAFGLPGTLSRRLSIQRAATVNPRSGAHHVVIKNTHALSMATNASGDLQDVVGRSQSLTSTHRVPILAPKRSDRTRLEHALSTVWTREYLPYPGMGINRGEQLIRSSANSVIRKLSKTSISSSLSKRSMSISSVTELAPDGSSKDGRVELTNEEQVGRSSQDLPREDRHNAEQTGRRFNLLSRPSFTTSRKFTRYHSYTSASADRDRRRDGLKTPGTSPSTVVRSHHPITTGSIEGLRTDLDRQ